jgi:hypothetical protein
MVKLHHKVPKTTHQQRIVPLLDTDTLFTAIAYSQPTLGTLFE